VSGSGELAEEAGSTTLPATAGVETVGATLPTVAGAAVVVVVLHTGNVVEVVEVVEVVDVLVDVLEVEVEVDVVVEVEVEVEVEDVVDVVVVGQSVVVSPAGAATSIRALIPVIELVVVSVAVIVWSPTVSRVIVKVPTPSVSVDVAGRPAADDDVNATSST
jgi:hypothetical protein